MKNSRDVMGIVAIIVCIITPLVLGLRDAWTGQLGGNSHVAELTFRAVALFFLFYVSLITIAEYPLISIGILLYGGMNLARGILALYAGELSKTAVTAASGAYVLLGLLGLASVAAGFWRGTQTKSPQPKSSSSDVPAWLKGPTPKSPASRTKPPQPQSSSSDVPAWLKGPTPESPALRTKPPQPQSSSSGVPAWLENMAPGSRAVKTPGQVSSVPAAVIWGVRILSFTGLWLNALAFQRAPLSESSGMSLIIKLLCIVFAGLSLAFVLLPQKQADLTD